MNEWQRRANLSSPPSRVERWMARQGIGVALTVAAAWAIVLTLLLWLLGWRLATSLIPGLVNGVIILLWFRLARKHVSIYEEARRLSHRHQNGTT